MKLYKFSFALMLGISMLTSCSDKLELTNPNDPTTGTFGNTTQDLEDAVIACYHHTRMEGTYARVGYTLECCRGDEVWNVAQSWNHLSADNLNVSIDNGEVAWIWRDWYYVINITNFVITKCGEDDSVLSEAMKRIKGQALFIRGLAYYNLSNFYQNPAIILDYNSYSSLEGLYAANHEDGESDPNAQYDRVLDQVEKDFSEAMTLLPTRDAGGEWAKGRATSGAAAGYYARALMQRHKYSQALSVLKDIIAGTYGHYDGETIEEEGVTYVKVPEVFETESVKDIVAKVTNIEFFLNMFSGVRNPEYRRPYEILADLDKIIIDALDSQAEELGDGNNGKLPAEILIPYKDAGDAIFKFSHFEIDESEPDASYRTAFVCYEFNTTVS